MHADLIDKGMHHPTDERDPIGDKYWTATLNIGKTMWQVNWFLINLNVLLYEVSQKVLVYYVCNA